MLSEKDVQIVRHLRNNARIKLTELSEKLNIPVTTLYGRLKSYEENLIRKHTCLIDFSRLGYYKSVYLVLKARENKTELRDFLSRHGCINTLLRINYGFDFLLECIFRNEKEVTDFLEELQDNYNPEIQMLNVVEELRKEDFMAGER